MTGTFDPQSVASIFDEYGDAEWSRHEVNPFDRVSFHVHRHYLRRFVRRDDRVLEVGAGAGRFTIELARLGARVTVVDISPEQLRLNEDHVAEARLEDAVEGRHLADMRDLSQFDDGSFDVTVCYGGPLSWALEDADRALSELLRATKLGGHVLVSVMSRFGALKAFLPGAADEIDTYGLEEMQAIVDTGFLPDNHSTLGPVHLYTWMELRQLLGRHPCTIVAASAANFLSVGNTETCERWLHDDPAVWERFLEWEVIACAQPGAIDGGTHIIAIVEAR